MGIILSRRRKPSSFSFLLEEGEVDWVSLGRVLEVVVVVVVVVVLVVELVVGSVVTLLLQPQPAIKDAISMKTAIKMPALFIICLLFL